MTADVEDEYVVAQANEPLDEGKHFIRPRVSARRRDDILEIDAEKVDYMDVSPRMMVSVATACIPFLENDDCNRALMGSNMQRQAVPLMVTQQPIVATGMEYKAATDSGTAVLAKTTASSRRWTQTMWSSAMSRHPGQLLADQVRPLQRRHLHQPASHRRGGRVRQGRPGPGRRPRNAQRRDLSGQERSDRLHDLGGLQLRGRRPAEREDRP